MTRHGGAESIASETLCTAAAVEAVEHATLAREIAKTEVKQPMFEWFMVDEQKAIAEPLALWEPAPTKGGEIHRSLSTKDRR